MTQTATQPATRDYTGWEIVLGRNDSSLFGNQSAEELATVDIEASVRAFDDEVERLVREEYPGADVTTGSGTHVYSPTVHPLWQEEARVHDTIADIADRVLDGREGDWVVYK